MKADYAGMAPDNGVELNKELQQRVADDDREGEDVSR